MALREQLRAGWARLRGGTLSPGRAAASTFVGLLVGCSPFYGLHAGIVLAICVPLRLDAAVAYIAAHISNPVTGPVLFALELEIGSLILTGRITSVSLEAARHIGILNALGQILLGWLVVGPVAAIIGASTAWALTFRVRDAREPGRAAARRRTLSRYRGAARATRWYVRIKLWTDPVLDVVASLEGTLGRVVDAGSGFGHVGLGLLDEGRASSLFGIDSDPERVEVARRAAGNDATFASERLEDAPIPECDTVLFTDSLHYLDAAAQEAVIERAARAIGPGGRVVVRETRAGTTPRSRLTERIERGAVRRRGGAQALTFLDPERLWKLLSDAGLAPAVVPTEQWSLLEHVLVVGTKRLE